jgi:hypothetical protein
LGQKLTNPTNESWWKFHLPSKTQVNNPPTLVGGIQGVGVCYVGCS